MASEQSPETGDIEISPEMIEAGEIAVSRFFSWELDDPEKVVRAVFLAMLPAYEAAKEARAGLGSTVIA